MAKKTISQALKDLFLGLGGDSSALADNTSASDYIQDLESAIKGIIPENELPTPEAADIGKVVSVVSDGDEGADYGVDLPYFDIEATSNSYPYRTITFDKTIGEIANDIVNNLRKRPRLLLKNSSRNTVQIVTQYEVFNDYAVYFSLARQSATDVVFFTWELPFNSTSTTATPTEFKLT